MKNPFWVFLVFYIGVTGCAKDSLNNSRDAALRLSSDSLLFDTVFTTTGSVTQAVKIINGNNQRLKISDIKLAGGTASMFSINVDGIAGPEHSNLVLEPNDSLYIFVAVTIKPGSADLPFIIR